MEPHVDKQERQLEAGRDKEQTLMNEVSNAKHEASLKMTSAMAELDSLKIENRRLEGECEQMRREMKTTREAAMRHQRAMADALELKTRLAEY